jgi:hypothetical protein
MDLDEKHDSEPEPRSPDDLESAPVVSGRKSEANTYDDDDEKPWFRQRRESSAKEDPFGDESDAEVKYRTMAWYATYSWQY